MLNRFSPLAAVFAVVVAGAAEAGIYKWVDEAGVVQYTQQPPISGIATEIKPAPPPAGEDAQAARARLQRQLDEFNERRAARRQTDEVQAQVEAERAEVSDFCTKARENLAIVNNNTRVMERGADGTLVPLTAEQIESKRQMLQAQIAELCQ